MLSLHRFGCSLLMVLADLYQLRRPDTTGGFGAERHGSMQHQSAQHRTTAPSSFSTAQSYNNSILDIINQLSNAEMLVGGGNGADGDNAPFESSTIAYH